MSCFSVSCHEFGLACISPIHALGCVLHFTDGEGAQHCVEIDGRAAAGVERPTAIDPIDPTMLLESERRGDDEIGLQGLRYRNLNRPIHSRARTMPLVKLFARSSLSKPIPLSALQSKMCEIWGTKPGTTKLILTRVDDWTSDSFNEDVYVDIRAYSKPERTREFVLEGMRKVQDAFKQHDLIANVRLEAYEGEKYFHVPPPAPGK